MHDLFQVHSLNYILIDLDVELHTIMRNIILESIFNRVAYSLLSAVANDYLFIPVHSGSSLDSC